MELASPQQVSDYLISVAHESGDVITNLKLQKLLFYSQAWHLALNGIPIFDEDFEAWVHGPVLPSQYRRFKGYTYNPISEDIKMPKLNAKLKSHLDEIMSVFGGEGAYALERMVHTEKPWLEARAGLPPDQASTNRIDKKVMKSYYKSMIDPANGQD